MVSCPKGWRMENTRRLGQSEMFPPFLIQGNNIQWGEKVFDTLMILQVFLLTKHVEVYMYQILVLPTLQGSSMYMYS
jgi:hypothetical protein